MGFLSDWLGAIPRPGGSDRMPVPFVRPQLPSSVSRAVAAFSDPLRRAIAAEIVALFNDPARGEQPVMPWADGLFPPGAVVRRVHGDVLSMMVGGVSGLLLQMLEPAVLAGVWDHSNFRADMHGRLRRTARFIALTTYGGRAEAEAAIARVNSIHEKVSGALADGTLYSARDPALLAWVHVTEAMSFLAAWIRYAEPRMSSADRDRYFAEMAQIGERLGADPVPRSQAEAEALIAAMRPRLRCDSRTREVARFILAPRPAKLATLPLQQLVLRAGLDLLPGWARRMHGFGPNLLGRPFVRAGAAGAARTLRWAFAG